jgi:hypothetical protein
MKTFVQFIEEHDPWLAIHYAYGIPHITQHPSKRSAHDEIVQNHELKDGGKRMGPSHYEYGGRHIVTKKSMAKKMGYDELNEVRLFPTDKKSVEPAISSVSSIRYLSPEKIKAYNDGDGNEQMHPAQYMSHLPSGHHLFSQSEKYGGSTKKYYAWNPKSKQVDMQVDGQIKSHQNGSKSFEIGDLAGREGSSLKAHDFYHHLITHHDHILSTSSQTSGGVKVWKKLSQKKDIHVHGWDPTNKSPVNVRTHDDSETHMDPTKSRDDDDLSLSRMHLIAHKKIPS